MGERRRRRVRRTRFGGVAATASLVVLCAFLTACEEGSGGPLDPDGEAGPGAASSDGSGGTDRTTRSSGDASYAVDPPGRFRPPLRTPDVLITATESLPDSLVQRVRRVAGVRTVVPFSLASASVDGRTLTVAAGDLRALRAFTPDATAHAQYVWDRVAGGEVAVDPTTPKKLVDAQDEIRLGNREDSPAVHVGAYAPLVQRSKGLGTVPVAQVLVNTERGEQLGLPARNALLVSTGSTTPSKLTKQVKKLLPGKASLQVLALEFDNATQTAVLAGTSVSDAIGTFTYTNGPDGTIKPDQGWVDAYIRTEPVPLLGNVTCNKAFIPQLRAALDEIVRSGLSSAIHPDEYAGCYYPRYIGRSAANGLSLHSWGIAVDLNVPGNLRGTRGEMDRRVVAIMKKWGMAWGGDWNYTDPMHFEMNRVVRPG